MIELNVPFHTPPPSSVFDPAVDPSDYDLVSLRSQTLQAPLTDILGLAELIASGDLTDDQRRLHTESLLREGRHLTSVIDHALALRRLETGHRDLDIAPVDLPSLIHRAVTAAGLDSRTPIAVRLPDQIPLVSADTEAILEVLANFLSNARVFSPNGGQITVEARPLDGMVEVSVRDHGIGLQMDDLPQLFKKFYRTDNGSRRRSPGAGLGLAINHRIIEAHGGQVSVMSRGIGKGTRFQFTLPVAQPVPKAEYILIVEDNAGFASLIRGELATLGFSTVRAADAETALHLIVAAPPRAVILDLVLPGLQGEELLDHLHAAFPTALPVVVLTNKSLDPHETAALENAGAIAVLPKEAGAPQAAVAVIAQALAPGVVAL